MRTQALESTGRWRVAKYVIRRTLLAAFILFWAAFATFAFISVLPGDFFTRFKIAIAVAGLPVEETHHALLVEHGLDHPWPVQFAAWIWRIIVKGSFGSMLKLPNIPGERQMLTLAYLFRSGGEIMNSLLICGTSMLVAWLLAIPFGAFSATRRGRWLYVGVSVLGMPSLAIPGYISAGLMLWFLDAVIDPMMSRAPLWGFCGWRFVGCPMTWTKFGSCLAHLLPIWIIIGLPVFTTAVRVLRGSMQDVIGQPYIVVARCKGLSSRAVYLKHALRVALNPLISVIGLSLPTVLVNALLVGFMFGIPTYGSLLKASIERQDPALLAAMMVFYSFVLVAGNLLADIGLAIADPRIRYD